MAEGKLRRFTDAELETLRRVINSELKSGANPRQRSGPSSSDLLDREEFPAPETYIAELPADGIPARVGLVPGGADCVVYQVIRDGDDAELEEVTDNNPRVFNHTETAIDGSLRFVLVTREKYGTFFAITGGGETSFLALLTAKDYEIEDPFITYSWARVTDEENPRITYERLAEPGDLTGTGSCEGKHDGVVTGGPGCWPAYHVNNNDLPVYLPLDEYYTGTGTGGGFVPPECVVRLRKGRGNYFLFEDEPLWELVVKDPALPQLNDGAGHFYDQGYVLTYNQYTKEFQIKRSCFLIDSGNYT